MIAAPYPADTRAKGWRFELDYEQIEQSSTWALAAVKAPEARGWLLVMWLASWKQVPCGSFPADEQVIAAMLGMPDRTWAKLRDVLMRGWTQADDGRIYHETISQRVSEMLEYRDKAKARKQEYRERAKESRGSPVDVPRDTTGKNDTGTGTGTGTKEIQEPPPLRGAPPSRGCRLPDGWEPENAGRDFALSLGIGGHRFNDEAAAFCDYWRAQPGQKGVKTDWPATWRNWCRKAAKERPQQQSFRQLDAEAKRAEVAQWGSGRVAAKPVNGQAEILDMEARHAALRLG